jgi:hypothetical protein
MKECYVHWLFAFLAANDAVDPFTVIIDIAT